MLLVKKSRKNQVALPKAILEQAGLGSEDAYFSVGYSHGTIVLRPVDIEEKLPPEALARFKAKTLKGQPGDHRAFSSIEAVIKDLKRRR